MAIDKRIRGPLLLVCAAVGSLVVLPRLGRRHRDAIFDLPGFRTFLTTYNGMTRRIAGTRRSSWGLLTHVGRRSGHAYQTSLGTIDYGDGFLLPLGYGPRTDWYRNLMAAGTGTLAWKGRTYRLERPELISGPEPMRAWPLASRIMLRLAGMHEFVWLHRSAELHTPPAQPATP